MSSPGLPVGGGFCRDALRSQDFVSGFRDFSGKRRLLSPLMWLRSVVAFRLFSTRAVYKLVCNQKKRDRHK